MHLEELSWVAGGVSWTKTLSMHLLSCLSLSLYLYACIYMGPPPQDHQKHMFRQIKYMNYTQIHTKNREGDAAWG